MLTLTQFSFAAETNLTRFERAGGIKALDIDKAGNIVLYLNNGIISTNDDCASFEVITEKMKGSPIRVFKDRIFAFGADNIHIFDLESKKWTDSILLPNGFDMLNIIEINDNEYRIGGWNDPQNDFILYKYEILSKRLTELFNSNGSIKKYTNNSYSYRLFTFNENALYKFTDSIIFKLDFNTQELESIYYNFFNGIGYGFIKDNFLYFKESNYEKSYLCTFIKRIDLKNNVVTEFEKTGYVNTSNLKEFGEYIFYQTDKKVLYDIKNDTSYLWPHLDEIDYLVKDKNGNYYSIPNLLKYDSTFKIIKSFLYYNYNELIYKYGTKDKLANNMNNNELLIYTDDGNVLKTSDKRFVYENITAKLTLNSEIKRIINDSKNNSYLFSKNGSVNFSNDNGITWKYFKFWTDDKQINNVELDSNGKFLILTDKGLYYFDPVLKKLIKDENFKDLFISALAIYKDFYLISSENGVYRYFRSSNKVELISNNKITNLKQIKSIVYRGDDKFYIFTESNGVYKFNNSKGKFIPFNYGFNPKVITNANIYRDSILIVNADKNVYVNKIGTLNWELLKYKKNPVSEGGQNLQITQNNEFILNVYNNLNDSINFENKLYSYFIQTDENIEKLIHSESGVHLFRLSKDKKYIYMFNNTGRFTKIDAFTGEIYDIKQLMSQNFSEYIVTGCDLQSNDSILIFGQKNKINVNPMDIFTFDIKQNKFLDSFKFKHENTGGGSVYGLAGLNFHFLSGDTTLFISKETQYSNSGSAIYYSGETNLYKFKQMEFIKNINYQLIGNISNDENNSKKLCFSTQSSEYKGSKNYYDNLFIIKQNYDTLNIIKQAKVWGDKSTARIAGYTITNDGKYAIYHRDSVFTSLYIINVSDFNLNKTVDLGSYDKIPLNSQSNNGKYLYFANANSFKIIDANTYETLEVIKYNPIESNNRVKLLEDSDNNILYILSDGGSIFKISGLKPGIVAAGFDYFPKNPQVGDIVNFKNTSKGLPASYKWYINNQLVSFETEFGYIFETDGLKTVTLIANKGEVSDTITKGFNVRVNPDLIVVAGFDYFPENPQVGDIVTFKNISKGLPTSYKWYINNQLVSFETEFGYIFETDGLKTVTLIANKGEVSDTITKSFNVSVKTSVNDAYAINELTISPNPATDFITIRIQPSEGLEPSEGLKMQIFDILGIELMSVGTSLDLSTQRIDVSHLSAGVYFIRIGSRVQKFVKM